MKAKPLPNVWVAMLSHCKCGNCGHKILATGAVSVGEYVRGKYRKWRETCPQCADELIAEINRLHPNGWEMQTRPGCVAPAWLVVKHLANKLGDDAPAIELVQPEVRPNRKLKR